MRKFGRHTCAAVIINNNFVVSAAHCTESGSTLGMLIVAGAHNRSDPLPSEQESNVLQIINHPRHNTPLRASNDISILRLGIPFTFNENVQPACPPRAVSYVDKTVTISGWGATFSGGSSIEELRYANVKVLSNEECAEKYPGRIDGSMICAAAPGRDACQGDSGGPLVQNAKGFYEMVGVTSWGVGCAREGQPGVFSNVKGAERLILGQIGVQDCTRPA